MPNTEAKIRVLIVDDHSVIREGLTLLLNAQPDLEVVGTADNGQDAVDLVNAIKPDVVIMDLHMPVMDGSDAMIEIRKANAGTKLIVLSSYKNDDEVHRAMSSGAHAYLLKDGPIEELARAVRNVHAGRSSLNPEIASTVLSRLSELTNLVEASQLDTNASGLNETELRMLGMLRDGASNPQIAEATGVSPNTVKTRLSRMYVKLSVTSRIQAVTEALKRGLITND